MRAMRAEGFSGYKDLKLADIPKPVVSEGRVLIKIAAAGVTPLEHTILSGGYPRAKAPLVLGSEAAGVVEDANGSEFSAGTRVMFTGPYGVSEDGTYSEYLAVRKENLGLIPECIDDVSAAGIPVAYLTAHMALSLAGFQAGKTVLDAIGGDVLSEALGTLAVGGSLTTLGYSASRKSTIDVTDLIWKRASVKSFSLFAQPPEMWRAAWKAIGALLESGAVKPIVARTFPLEDAAEALRYQIDSRPFGRIVLEI
jgi:NADPH:quinone reductase-like Zn-dependent oxidoreductase